MDAALGRAPAGDRHPERVVGQFRRHARRHRPADDPPRPHVHQDGQVEPALMGPHVGDVREPHLVRPARGEVAAHQVGRGARLRRRLPCLAFGALGAAARRAGPAVVAHDARHALAGGAHARLLELLEHLRGAVDAAAGGVYLGDRRGQLGVAQVVRARRPLPPCVVALPGDMEGRAHLGYAPGALVEQDESELRPLRLRAYSCLLAKKALAFKSISFSLFSRSFSRLSLRRSSAIWKGLSPAGACAASALLTQSDRLPGSTPSSRAIGGPPLVVEPHGLLLELCRILGRRMSHPMPPFPAYGIMPKRNSVCQREWGRFRFRERGVVEVGVALLLGEVLAQVLADEAVEQHAEHVLLEVPAVDASAQVLGDGPDGLVQLGALLFLGGVCHGGVSLSALGRPGACARP